MNVMESNWFGIASIIFGSFLNYFGIILQKRQVNKLNAKGSIENSTTELKIYLKDKLWVSGILLQTILCLPFLLYGLQVLGITLAQPLANGCVLFLVIGAVFVLNEKLALKDYGGIFILVTGMILIGFGGVAGQITINLIMEPTTIHKLIIFMVILLIGVFSLAILLKKFQSIVIACYGLMAGIFYSIVSISLQIFSVAVANLSKNGSLGFFIIGIIGFVSGTVCAIYATQEGFKQGQAIQFIPFSQISMNVLPVIAGQWIFQQVIFNVILFWIGMLLIIAGASIVARFQK